MPITYENTDRLVRFYGSKLRKLSPSPDVTSFLAGMVVGFFVLPIVLPIVGYQVTKRWGPKE
jgi:hypothetical protein